MTKLAQGSGQSGGAGTDGGGTPKPPAKSVLQGEGSVVPKDTSYLGSPLLDWVAVALFVVVVVWFIRRWFIYKS